MAKIPAKANVEFKRAWKQSLLNHDVNGQKLQHFAATSGLSESTLYATADEGAPDAWISIRRFIAVIPELKDLSVLDYLDSLAVPRRIAFQLPDELGPVCSASATAQMMRKMAAALESKTQAEDGDGKWTTDEATDFRRKADDLTRCVQAIAAYAERVAQPSVRELKAVVK
jgi:hypothetical protein